MGKLNLSREVLAFFVVLVVAAAALFFVNSPGMDNITFLVFSQPKVVFDNTVVLTNLNLGETFSQEIPPLTGTYLNALRDRTISTNAGSSRYRQIIRLSNRQDGLLGGQIDYLEDPRGDVGDFLSFPKDQPIFEWEVLFTPALESDISGNRMIDLENERLNVLGKDYVISRAEISGDRVTLRLFGPSYIEFVDDIDDSDFTNRAEVAGRSVDAEVKIMATRSGNTIRISSITYRFNADHKLGGDVLVPKGHGVRQYVRQPHGMLNPYFEIIYGGIRGGLARGAISRTPRISGNSVLFKPSGGDEYNLIFTNTRGQSYIVPFATTTGSGVKLGEEDRDLVVKEGSSTADFNIEEGDMFVVTSDDDIKASTNVLEFDGVDFANGEAFFVDLAGSTRQENFNPATGQGRLLVSGQSYTFYVETVSPHRIVVDQTNDGSFGGDSVDFVILGGARIQVGSSAGSSIGVDFRTPERLFDDRDGDEVVDLTITKEGSDINLLVPSQTNLKLEEGRDGVESGMTRFGTLFRLDEEDTPSELLIDFPTGGRSVAPFVRGGQAQGWVIITLELDRLLAAAAERNS